MSGQCQCPQARAWRAYWTRDAIAERLQEEVELYRGIIFRAVFWGNRYYGRQEDPPRVDCSMSTVDLPESFAAREKRRAEKAPWPPS